MDSRRRTSVLPLPPGGGAGGGFGNLLLTAWEFAKACLHPVVEPKCGLVNAAIVGGLRDNERRQPVKVFI